MKFSIKKTSIKYLQTRNGVAYTAELYMGKNKVCKIHNDGQGGDTHQDGSLGRLKWALDAEAKEMFPEGFEPTSQYLEHLMNEAEGVN